MDPLGESANAIGAAAPAGIVEPAKVREQAPSVSRRRFLSCALSRLARRP
jgi:hypothetical protein